MQSRNPVLNEVDPWAFLRRIRAELGDAGSKYARPMPVSIGAALPAA